MWNRLTLFLLSIIMIACSSGSDKEQGLYNERLRPQFHYLAQTGWINDPCGLVYYDGEYHMFPIAHPDNWDGGELSHWGHAVSPDLIHWEQLPWALEPDTLGGIWAGSMVVDHHNSAGFQTGDEKTLVALYSASSQVQCLAYSNDRGRTWNRSNRR